MYILIHVDKSIRRITSKEIDNIGFTHLMGILQKAILFGIIDKIEVISDEY